MPTPDLQRRLSTADPPGSSSPRGAVELPGAAAAVAMPACPAAGEAETPGDATAAQRGRLLIVDDEVVFAAAIRRMFSNEHEVSVVHCARDAIAVLRTGVRFDAILCDLQMPEISGMELYRELRRFAPEAADCMIFLTGDAFSERAQHFLDEIPNRWFEKPCNLNLLRAGVREVVVRSCGR